MDIVPEKNFPKMGHLGHSGDQKGHVSFISLIISMDYKTGIRGTLQGRGNELDNPSKADLRDAGITNFSG